MPVNVLHYLKQQAQLVEEALDRYTTPGGGAEAGPLLEGAPPKLLEAMRYSLLGGGKRLRPALVIAAASLYGVEPQRVMPTACALEMIHTYSLVHDDLPCMDDDDLRRGRPTNHKVYGEAMATLVGDGLLTLAFELLGRQAAVEGIDPARAVRVVAEVAAGAGAAGMVGGQVEDLEWEGRRAGGPQLQRIHAMKTGALFRASLRAGAILSGGSEADLNALDRYAEQFGLAFQIQDDVLDVIGDAVKTGKGVGRDAKHEKSTYVSLYGLEGAQERARAAVAQAVEALRPFGERARVLRALAEFVVDREG
ncbi:MAG: polyprenyl synthetase family protein [Bacillota bacterium]